MKTRFGTRLLGLALIVAVVLMTVVAGAAASPGNSIFAAVLHGSEENPPVDTNASAVAGIRFSQNGNRLNYTIVMRGVVNITASHIHCGARGNNGPVGVTFVPKIPVINGSVTAPDANNRCGWTTLDDVYNALVSGNAYVNVHTQLHPSGFIRGQAFLVSAN